MPEEEVKTGKNSPFTNDQIEEVFGADAHMTSVVTRTAQGRYLYGKRPRGQAALTAGDMSQLTAKIVLQEVFGLERAMPMLASCCRPMPMAKLIQSFRVASQSSASRKVAKGQEPDLNLNKFLEVKMECWLNASHVAGYWEDNWESDTPIMTVTEQDAANALAYARNLDIADELLNAYNVTGEDWGAGTIASATYSPFTKIMEAWTQLAGGSVAGTNAGVKANPSILAMGPLAWGDFVNNSYVRDFVMKGLIRTPTPGGAGNIDIPLLPSLQIILDGDLLSTSAYLIDPRYFLLGQGPTQAIGYSNDLKRVEGHVLYEYLQPKLVWDQSETYTLGVREITGVHA
jgi:hypothetical protein